MHIHPRFIIGALLATGAFAGIDSARACGEVMYRMGGALRYQAFVTRHPAAILLYGGGDVAGANAADRDDFRRKLEKAGHKVTVAASADAFALAVATHDYDIVIAPAVDVPALRPALTSAQRAPSTGLMTGQTSSGEAGPGSNCGAPSVVVGEIPWPLFSAAGAGV